ncbi:hypothetical protein GQ54DRAFT_258147 [Martensiomyces pterosporus]|nr:hypothetical protein GQ54DRAFT_258147 [Martensiomyces pterosporus]
MSSNQTLQALSSLLKNKKSRRSRKEKSKQNLSVFARRTTTAKPPKKEEPASADTVKDGKAKRPDLAEAERTRQRNTVLMRTGDKLTSVKGKDLQREVLEMIRAQGEHRNPKFKRKRKATFYDFEDEE